MQRAAIVNTKREINTNDICKHGEHLLSRFAETPFSSGNSSKQATLLTIDTILLCVLYRHSSLYGRSRNNTASVSGITPQHLRACVLGLFDPYWYCCNNNTATVREDKQREDHGLGLGRTRLYQLPGLPGQASRVGGTVIETGTTALSHSIVALYEYIVPIKKSTRLPAAFPLLTAGRQSG